MKRILTLREQDINPDVPVDETIDYKNREAARAVVLDPFGQVALLHVGLYDYHKLPGGGITTGEDVQSALERELLEEIGCRADVTSEVGEIFETRDEQQLAQTSYCFLARQIGEKGKPDFTEKELAEKFSIKWAKSIDEAISLLENDRPTNYGGKFIQKRDQALLKAAKEMLAQ